MNNQQWVDWARTAPLEALRLELDCTPRQAHAVNARGQTLLSLAAGDGDAPRVLLLLPFSDAHFAPAGGYTPLMQAALHAHPACVALLLPHSPVDHTGEDGYNALMIALEQEFQEGSLECVRLLASVSNLSQRTIEKGRSLHSDGRTPLMLAAQAWGSAALEALLPFCSSDQVRACDARGDNALMLALQGPAEGMLQKIALLAPLSDLSARLGDAKQTVLMQAAHTESSCTGVVQTLLPWCSTEQCQLQDVNGRDALMIAINRGESLAVEALAPRSNLSNRQTRWQETALFLATGAANAQLRIAQCVARHCTREQFLLRDTQGRTALDCALNANQPAEILDVFASVMPPELLQRLVNEHDASLIPQTLAAFERQQLTQALGCGALQTAHTVPSPVSRPLPPDQHASSEPDSLDPLDRSPPSARRLTRRV